MRRWRRRDWRQRGIVSIINNLLRRSDKMAFICYSSIHRHSKWHPIRLGCWWKLFSFNIIRRFFFGYGTDHYSDYYFLEGAENPESSIKFNNYKSINKSWCILGWFKISKIHFPVYKTTRRIYPYPGWHLKDLCHAIFYLFKKLKLVFKYKWSSFAVPMNGKEGHAWSEDWNSKNWGQCFQV